MNNMRGYENGKIIKGILVFVAIAFVVVYLYNYISLPLDSVNFSPGNFYRAVGNNESTKINPQKYYQDLYGFSSVSSPVQGCQTAMQRSNDTTLIPTNPGCVLPFTSTDMPETKEAIATMIGPEAEGKWSAENKDIFSPVQVEFVNSNQQLSFFDKSLSSKVNIECKVGKYVLVFEDVATWWCHRHDVENSSSHTQAVGNIHGSLQTTAYSSAIIGVAKDTTKLKTYRIPDEYKGELTFDMLKQVHTGEYLAGYEEPSEYSSEDTNE